MKIGIMQPYFFPYIGYYQLVKCVDVFVFLDDVNFIKRGWINRNRILVNHKEHLITLPCKGVSQNKLIHELEVDWNNKEISKLLKTIETSYKKAPYFIDTMELIVNVFNPKHKTMSYISIESIVTISKYLGINTEFKISSEEAYFDIKPDRADRLIGIAKKESCKSYVNPISGSFLYEKDYFSTQGMELLFLKSGFVDYRQFNDQFIPQLSIIDVLMFNSVSYIKDKFLNEFDLI